MHLSISVEVGLTDFRTKSKARHEFISIVIQYDIADLVDSFLVLTLLDWSDIVQGVRLILNAIAGSEVDADHHGHLHAACQIISEIVFEGLLEVLENYDSLLRLVLGEGESEISTGEIVEIGPCLSDQQMPGIAEIPEDDWLFGVIIAQPLLVYLNRREPIILPILHLTLVKQVVLTVFDLVELPMPSSLTEAKEVRANVYISADKGEFDVLTGTALDFFASEVHSTDLNALSLHVFFYALVPCIEDLTDCGRGLPKKLSMRGGTIDLNDDLLAN